MRQRIRILIAVSALVVLIVCIQALLSWGTGQHSGKQWVRLDDSLEVSSIVRNDGRQRCLAKLSDRLARRVQSLVLPDKPVAYLDPPLHENLGDSYIWAGTNRVFDRLGVLPDMTCALLHFPKFGNETVCDQNAMDLLLANGGTILFLGGGNFGDLYYILQLRRLGIIERFPHVRIVVLSNDMHYDNTATALKDFEKLVAHPDLHILFRNTRSYDAAVDLLRSLPRSFAPQAEGLIDRIYIEPDFSMALGNLGAYDAASCPNGPTYDIVFLLRGDAEVTPVVSASTNAALEFLAAHNHTFMRYDWFSLWDSKVRLPLLRRNVTLPLDWRIIPDLRVEIGRSILCHGRAIVTDRLHAFVLGSMLMGKPVAYLDNSYGKTTDYINTWINKDSPYDCYPEFFPFVQPSVDTTVMDAVVSALEMTEH